MYASECYVKGQLLNEGILLESLFGDIKSKLGGGISKVKAWKKQVSADLRKHKINEAKAYDKLRKIANKHAKAIGMSMVQGYKTRNFSKTVKYTRRALNDAFDYIKGFIFGISWQDIPISISKGLISVATVSLFMFFFEIVMSSAFLFYFDIVGKGLAASPALAKIPFLTSIMQLATKFTYYIISGIISFIFLPIIKETSRALAVMGGYGDTYFVAMTVADVYRMTFYYGMSGLSGGLTKLGYTMTVIGTAVINTVQTVITFIGSLPYIKDIVGPWVYAVNVGVTAIWEGLFLPMIWRGKDFATMGLTPGEKVQALGKTPYDVAQDLAVKSAEGARKILDKLGMKWVKLPPIPDWLKRILTTLNNFLDDIFEKFFTRNMPKSKIDLVDTLTQGSQQFSVTTAQPLIDKFNKGKPPEEQLTMQQVVDAANKKMDRKQIITNTTMNLANPVRAIKSYANSFIKMWNDTKIESALSGEMPPITIVLK